MYLVLSNLTNPWSHIKNENQETTTKIEVECEKVRCSLQNNPGKGMPVRKRLIVKHHGRLCRKAKEGRNEVINDSVRDARGDRFKPGNQPTTRKRTEAGMSDCRMFQVENETE